MNSNRQSRPENYCVFTTAKEKINYVTRRISQGETSLAETKTESLVVITAS